MAEPASPVENRRGGARVVLPPPLVFLSLVLLGMFLEARAPLSWPGDRPARVVAAFVCAAAGLALGVSTLALFHRSGQEPEPWKPTPALIARGAYRFSRNPMYLGMFLLHAAAGLALEMPWVTLLAVPALLVVHFTAVLPEERYLRHRFGAGYEGYMASVPRYLGRRRTTPGPPA